jgi:hypothetical protein
MTGIDVTFTLDYPNEDKILDLSDALKIALEKLQQSKDKLNLQVVIEVINDVAAAEFENLKRLNCFKINLEPSENQLQEIRVEYFECLPFEIKLVKPDLLIKNTILNITRISSVSHDGSVAVPAFSIAKINKCKPADQDPDVFCKDLDLKLEIKKIEQDGSKVTLQALPSGIHKPVAYLWEVPDADRPYANKQKAEFTFKDADDISTPKKVRLIAFTKDGCRAFKETVIDINKSL